MLTLSQKTTVAEERGVMKLAKKLTNPATLSHGVCNSSVLRLSTRPRDRCLPLRRPGDQVIAKVDAVT
jgi:hypothetical protein